MIASGSPIFKNKLQKAQNMSKFTKHRAQLQLIARRSYRYPYIDQSYKQRIYQNKKGMYFKEQRTKQIQIQNASLLNRIDKLKSQTKSSSFWLKDRSHSLNQIVKKDALKNIEVENKRMLKKILLEKPHISAQKLNKSSIEQQKLSVSISKLQKYKMLYLPHIDNKDRDSQDRDGKSNYLSFDKSFHSVSSAKKSKAGMAVKMELDYLNQNGSIQNQQEVKGKDIGKK